MLPQALRSAECEPQQAVMSNNFNKKFKDITSIKMIDSITGYQVQVKISMTYKTEIISNTYILIIT